MLATQSQRSTWGGTLSEFRRGLIEPSFPSAVGIVAASLLPVLVCAFVITPGLVAGWDPGLLMKRGNDDYGLLTAQALQIAAQPDRPSITMIGASSLKHGLVDDARLEALLEERLGYPMAVHNFTAPTLTLWEAASITDLLAQHGKHVFVIAVSPKKLATPRRDLVRLVRQPRLGFQTSAFDEELQLAGLRRYVRTGNYLLDNFWFYLVRYESVMHFFTGPVVPERYQDKSARVPEAEWNDHMARLRGFFDGYDEWEDENLGVLERIIRRARDAGSRVVLLEPPINPRAATYVPSEVDTAYREAIASFARAQGVPYIDSNVGLEATDEDFHDWTHIRNEAVRLACSTSLIDQVARLIASGEGAP